MQLKVTTTITTLVDIDTFEPEHNVVVEAETGVPESIARAAALSAARSLVRELGDDGAGDESAEGKREQRP